MLAAIKVSGAERARKPRGRRNWAASYRMTAAGRHGARSNGNGERDLKASRQFAVRGRRGSSAAGNARRRTWPAVRLRGPWASFTSPARAMKAGTASIMQAAEMAVFIRLDRHEAGQCVIGRDRSRRSTEANSRLRKSGSVRCGDLLPRGSTCVSNTATMPVRGLTSQCVSQKPPHE